MLCKPMLGFSPAVLLKELASHRGFKNYHTVRGVFCGSGFSQLLIFCPFAVIPDKFGDPQGLVALLSVVAVIPEGFCRGSVVS